MKKSVEYEFFYLDDDVNPYAYSGDKEILKLFKLYHNDIVVKTVFR